MRNILEECGYSRFEIEDRIIECWNNIFDQKNPNHFYFDAENTFDYEGKVIKKMGYMEDTGNDDARTEGMSYGMMMALQMNRKDIFDRIWNWAKTYMYLKEGPLKGYFCWSNTTKGKMNSDGPAPDGEEYFAAALFLASKKWDCGEGIYNYLEEGRAILRTAIHSEKKMWFENHHIRFIPNSPYTDPSYHIPQFYELFAEYADEWDKEFWQEAAKASREYLVKACHPVTGLAAELADDDGKPLPLNKHGSFFSDAYRVAANIGFDALWNGVSPDLSKIASNIINFFDGKSPEKLMEYSIDGKSLKRKARHPVGLIATVAEGAIAVLMDDSIDEKNKEAAKRAVKRLWETPMRTGRRRYYDNCLYFFAMLALSGKYSK